MKICGCLLWGFFHVLYCLLSYCCVWGILSDFMITLFGKSSWAQLFKTNAVISYHIVKSFIIKYGIYANIFAEKCICKSYSHFFNKNICELDIVLTRTVNILTTNELVKLTMLWTTGPWLLCLLVCGIVLSVMVCLLFLIVSLVGCVLWLWLFLDISYSI